MSKLLFIDTETGGIDPEKHSLLSIGYVLMDNDQIVARGEYFLRSEKYCVTETAAMINHFDLYAHMRKAVPAEEIIKAFDEINTVYFGGKGIELAGHNTQFDVRFIRKMYADAGRSYEKVFSHRVVDTYSILRFLRDAGMIDMDHLSSAKAFGHFGIKVKGRHTASGDAEATLELYQKLMSLIKK